MSDNTSTDVKSASDKLYDNVMHLPHNYTYRRIEFIKLFVESMNLIPMFDGETYGKQKVENLATKTSINEVFNKDPVPFGKVINRKDISKFIYVKSGTTGHTFKCISIPDPSKPNMSIECAIKVVAYPKISSFGSIDNIKRPENAELVMLKLLASLVVARVTPHIVLPITTFNTHIMTFISPLQNGTIKKKKYEQFLKRYNNDEFHDQVSILISEWANGGDLGDFLHKNYANLKVREWRVIFFQIIITIALIQDKYPGFRHNDLKPNNILIQKIAIDGNKDYSVYMYNDNTYKVPNIGMCCKIWDFDFACIPGMIDNLKVEHLRFSKSNVKPEAHPYYDIHYFFTMLASKSFVPNFFESYKQKDGKLIPYVSPEVTSFVRRVIPPTLQGAGRTSEQNRLLLTYREMCTLNIQYKTPIDIINIDPFFSEFRQKRK
jgi:serine/threonine protein kinase